MDFMLDLPEDNGNVYNLLENTPMNRIFLTSDWHINAHKYGKDDTKVNLKEIIDWCKKRITDNDIFLYLGDICFRWANEEDSREAQDIMCSLPGHKILIIGNHDAMQGEKFYLNCGFDYVFDQLQWHNILFTHKPVNVEKMSGVDLNIHGHLHDNTFYMTTDGKDNVNVFSKSKPFTLEYLLKHIEEKTRKNYWQWNAGFGESSLLETKRSNLPDSAFGDPVNRKYPLDSEQHVKSAIKLFGHGKVDDKKLLAKRISAAAKRYNIKIDPNTQVAKALNESEVSMDELSSLASINPVRGIMKPFIIKCIPNKLDCTINTKQYLFSPDVISDKYLAINEDAHLEVVPASKVNEYYIEAEYEFTGNIQNFMKVFEAYRDNKTVDQTFFYTALTGKPMLTEDQIDFDENFKKVDFQGIKFGVLSELATNANIFNREILPFNEAAVDVDALNDDERRLYSKYNDMGLSTKYSLEGYYVESSILDRRSAYVDHHSEVNESLIMSVIGGCNYEQG